MKDFNLTNLVLRAAVICCSAVLLASCGSKKGSNMDPMHEIGLKPVQTIKAGGVERQYRLYLPSEPSSAAIVLLLHGNGGTSSQTLGLDGTVSPFKQWLDIALRENLILVVPDGLIGSNAKQGWNDCRTDAPTNHDGDDVAFISALLDEVQTKHGNPSSKIYSTGTSNGGLMTQRLADVMPERLSAAAVLVASKPVNSECIDSTQPLPILFMNGTNDPILPYSGGQIGVARGVVLSTDDTVLFWIARNKANSSQISPVIIDIDQRDNSSVLHYSYPSTAGAPVEHYEIVNGGHTEPSVQHRYGRIYKLVVGTQNADIEMAEVVWDFFKRF